jgi:hypothetical protein
MKFTAQFALVALVSILAAFVPTSAYAAAKAGTARTHSQTYHDRSPGVHTHSSHPHHG